MVDESDQTQGTDWSVANDPHLFVLWKRPHPMVIFGFVSLRQDVKHVGVPSEGKGQTWKNQGHPLIVVVEYLFTHISTHSLTVVLIDLVIH